MDEYKPKFGLRHVKMPPGYSITRLDSGHYMWTYKDGIRESAIHWDKWQVYRWAWNDYQGAGAGAGG